MTIFFLGNETCPPCQPARQGTYETNSAVVPDAGFAPELTQCGGHGGAGLDRVWPGSPNNGLALCPLQGEAFGGGVVEGDVLALFKFEHVVGHKVFHAGVRVDCHLQVLRELMRLEP